jgi:hypothetical protein
MSITTRASNESRFSRQKYAGRVEEKFDRARRALCFVSGRALSSRNVFPTNRLTVAESRFVAKPPAPTIRHSLLNREEKPVSLGTSRALRPIARRTPRGRFSRFM